MITPAIWCCRRVEGLRSGDTPPSSTSWLPFRIFDPDAAVLLQRRGTPEFASFFGPVMVTCLSFLASYMPVALLTTRRASCHTLIPRIWFVAGHGHIGWLLLVRRGSRSDRRRGSLCRPGHFAASRSGWLVRTGIPLAGHQLFRTGLAGARQFPPPIENPFFSSCSRTRFCIPSNRDWRPPPR